jgi:hypothetical protein
MFTHQEGLGQCQHFILGQIPVLILVVEVEEPFDILHQVIEHDAIQTRYEILRSEGTISKKCHNERNLRLPGTTARLDTTYPRSRTTDR